MINEKELLEKWFEAVGETDVDVKKLAIASILTTILRAHGYKELAEEVRTYFKK